MWINDAGDLFVEDTLEAEIEIPKGAFPGLIELLQKEVIASVEDVRRTVLRARGLRKRREQMLEALSQPSQDPLIANLPSVELSVEMEVRFETWQDRGGWDVSGTSPLAGLSTETLQAELEHRANVASHLHAQETTL